MTQSLKHHPGILTVPGKTNTSATYSSRAAVVTLQSSQSLWWYWASRCEIVNVKQEWIGSWQFISTITCLWQHMVMGLHVETHLWKWISSSCCSLVTTHSPPCAVKWKLISYYSWITPPFVTLISFYAENVLCLLQAWLKFLWPLNLSFIHSVKITAYENKWISSANESISQREMWAKLHLSCREVKAGIF